MSHLWLERAIGDVVLRRYTTSIVTEYFHDLSICVAQSGLGERINEQPAKVLGPMDPPIICRTLSGLEASVRTKRVVPPSSSMDYRVSLFVDSFMPTTTTVAV